MAGQHQILLDVAHRELAALRHGVHADVLRVERRRIVTGWRRLRIGPRSLARRRREHARESEEHEQNEDKR